MENFLNNILSIIVCFSITAFAQIEQDDYPITNSMLQEAHSTKANDLVNAFDKIWFSNDSLQEILVFELHTDYHRYLTYHFRNDDIPFGLIERFVLYKKVGKGSSKLLEDSLKLKYFDEFILASNKVDKKYFTSSKGFKLGAKKELAIQEYGNPDSVYFDREYEICEWWFTGDMVQKEKSLKVNEIYAKNSFGYEVTMFFNKDELRAMILLNQIP